MPSRVSRATTIAFHFAMLLGPLFSYAHAASNPVVAENAKPGDSGWQNDRPGFTYAEDKSGEIAGYASDVSVNIGDTIRFRVSVNDPSHRYSIDIYRMGYYGGKGGRRMRSVTNLPGVQQPACPKKPDTGLIECDWSDSYTLRVPFTWTSGIYMAMLTRDDGYFRRIAFVVRNDYRRPPIVYQQPVMTYQAYNCWPCEAGGKSLYESNSSQDDLTISGTPRAVQVSFDRPTRDEYGNGTGDAVFAPDSAGWEMYLVQWLEREGYDVGYTTDIDTHRTRGFNLFGAKAFISAGHDEYWSATMFDAVQRARDNRLNLAFMGANAIYWQVRVGASSRGVANRVIICYKDALTDPITTKSLRTLRWRDPAGPNRPEQTLIGVQFTSNLENGNDPHFDLTVQNSAHWAYRNTGFTDGSKVKEIVGYEIDRLHPEYPGPTSVSYTTLARSDFIAEGGTADYSEASIYQARSGAWVFASGTMAWSRGLMRTGQINSGLQQTTRNILNRFISR